MTKTNVKAPAKELLKILQLHRALVPFLEKLAVLQAENPDTFDVRLVQDRSHKEITVADKRIPSDDNNIGRSGAYNYVVSYDSNTRHIKHVIRGMVLQSTYSLENNTLAIEEHHLRLHKRFAAQGLMPTLTNMIGFMKETGMIAKPPAPEAAETSAKKADRPARVRMGSGPKGDATPS